jgi:hypothetical protein
MSASSDIHERLDGWGDLVLGGALPTSGEAHQLITNDSFHSRQD